MTVIIKDEQVLGLSRLSKGWRSMRLSVNMETGSIKMTFETTAPISFHGSFVVTSTITNVILRL